MAKVCLIYPRDTNLNYFPIGVGYIASSLLKRGHDVTLLDISKDEIHLLDRIKNLKPDIVGISITTSQVKLAKMAVDRIKNTIPGVPIAAGGIHPSYFKGAFIREFGIDYVVYGEGENTMCELCDAVKDNDPNAFSRINGLVFKNKNGEIVVNSPRDLIKELDGIPSPARELVNYEAYLKPPGLIRGIWTDRSANVITSRGCPGRCTYCGANYLWGKTYRRRSVDNVLEEIDQLVSDYNIDSIYFLDDTFLMVTDWIEEFCEKFVARRYNLKWACYGRVDTVNERILTAVKRAGCVQAEYGIESCSEQTLKYINKKTSYEMAVRAIRMTKNAGLRAQGGFMVGLPSDTEGNLAETIKLASNLDLDFLTCYVAVPYPGSALYEQAVTEGRILEGDMSKWYVRNTGIWDVGLDVNIINKYRNMLLRSYRSKNALFFIKNPKFLVKLLFLALKNYRASFAAIKLIMEKRCFDDVGYYFYAALSANRKSRNKI